MVQIAGHGDEMGGRDGYGSSGYKVATAGRSRSRRMSQAPVLASRARAFTAMHLPRSAPSTRACADATDRHRQNTHGTIGSGVRRGCDAPHTYTPSRNPVAIGDDTGRISLISPPGIAR